MPRKTLPLSGLPEDFRLTEKTLDRLARDYPTIDVEGTLDKFIRKADALGWMYRNWQSAFLNYCDNGQKYGGVEYKQGRAQDPRWLPILNEARPYGFRMPYPTDTPSTYRTDFESWKRKQDVGKRVYEDSRVIEFAKGFGK